MTSIEGPAELRSEAAFAAGFERHRGELQLHC
jgi:hypothetical protein